MIWGKVCKRSWPLAYDVRRVLSCPDDGCRLGLWPLAYYCQSVTQWQHDTLKACVACHMVVELTYGDSLPVAVILCLHHMSVPQCVVSEDERSGRHDRQEGLDGVYVCPLVSVDECHIECYAMLMGCRWCGCYGVCYAECDAVGPWRLFYPWACEGFLLVVYLEGVEMAMLPVMPPDSFQTLGEAEGGVAGECPHLDDILWACHDDEHAQEASLEASARHAPVEHVYVCGPPQAVEIFGLGVGVGHDIMVYGVFSGECGVVGVLCVGT